MSLRLGVLIPVIKKKKIKLPQRILKLCEDEDIEVIDLDYEDFVEKGPFDVLLHKVTDYYNELEDADAALRIRKVKEYCTKFKEMVVIDDFDNSERLTDRVYQTELMKSCEMCLEGIKIFVPKIMEISEECSLEKINEIVSSNRMKFPILAKPAVASITEHSHEMKLIFGPANLKDLRVPCLIQEFCNHGGVVYKVYIVGEKFNMCERPSIKDVYCEPSRDTLYFDTRNVSKIGKSFLPDLHCNDPNERTWKSCDENPNLLNRNVVSALTSALRKSTNLHLLGIDILIENETGNYALIDVNHFPGYSGINENYFPQNIVRLVKELGSKKIK